MAFLIKMAVFLELLQALAWGMFRASLHPRHRGLVTGGDLLILLVIPLAGLFGHAKDVFYLLLFVLPLFWIADPALLARRYVLVLVQFPELDEVYASGGVYLGVLSAPIIFNAGAFLALALTRRRMVRPVRSIDAAVWGLFLIALVFTARGQPFNGTLRYVATTLLLVIPPYFIVARAPASQQAAGDTISFVVLGGLCNAVVGIFESVKHWAMYETFYQTLHVKLKAALSANVMMRAGLLRANGAVGNYEVLGLVTGVALIAAIATRRRFTTPGFLLIVVVLAGGLFSSQARSAWIATGVGLVLQAFYDRRWRRLGVMLGTGAVAGALAAAASANGAIGQMLGKGGSAQGTGQYRRDLANRGMEEVMRHPITGQTFDQLQVSMNDLRQGEHIIDFVNTHLVVMLTGGIGALVLWLVVWAVPMTQAWRSRASTSGGGNGVSAGHPFAVIGMTFFFLTFTSPVDRILSIVAVAMGLASLCVRLPSLTAIRHPRRSAAEAAAAYRLAPGLATVELGASPGR